VDRSDADLAWETELLQHLGREGLTVPVPIPTTDGRLFADGLVVMTYVEGGPPETEADWRRVADTLRRLHRFREGDVFRHLFARREPSYACGVVLCSMLVIRSISSLWAPR
jgi:Ser/Thr protein kinase RdoA (MazF antagonist)